MYTQFNELPDSSRVWIYQANRPLSFDEVEFISAKTINFIDQWKRHGDDLKGAFTIKYNQFFILGVDESFNNVSGCSIDASVRLVKELERALKIDLTDKMNVTYKEGDAVLTSKLADFQDLANEGEITSNTIVFNNMVNTKEALLNEWEVEASKSWHSRFIK